MKGLDDSIGRFLDGLDQAGRKRVLRPVDPLPAGRVRVGGRELVNFSSNDYLGLSRHPEVVERSRRWLNEYGAGSGASRLVTGHLAAMEALEAKIARCKQTEAALILASGWQCNASVLPALLDKALWGAEPLVFADKLIHASLHAGLELSGARRYRYRHDDLDHLESLLKAHADKEGPRFIVTETVFSMDGDVTDMAALAALASRWDAFLYVDEAHATGVLGANGFGLSPGMGAELAMGTFSKGLGSFGAYVACSARLRHYLINRASGLIYATGLPPAVLGAIDAALDLVPRLEGERTRLQMMGRRLRDGLRAAGLDTGPSASQIVPLILGDEGRTLAVAKALEDRGILGIAIRPPTVPPGTSRIRFALSAVHSDADLDRLLAAILDAVEATP
ncbi:8-amino-7-oxononanoate synthase [Paramagnetospirillum magneticum]|uniref:Putative 8-amino-7-oxononanoate synthase n=1 Tax=Paramagnetospirillum magneticum (strain ATCC 700264 / AMB-1) TaxID=342108 RepID=BIOF_PARM1|nr:8-amino-7-oxononanoate synthase [Paramagnetospirillum magneticum]Q2W3L2.1 RecName: Full=Putative 8-amino-7-oxononanoate synthase; Short=AONS; AltName: Full=7-keto-8-amino-pelargonic acid synthase; Short=7-KAP synthase; AltName: Full=8-amino-7-ketopelargonate synthase [Paramagnetospirillum magneticum AMB-1]BAE51563.1 7-keto-8-aminopelargonate synthetase and related enzyme [Paramagnetospirillum magneticum AMB-1]